jgi:high-affinity Fe2+/Pb2+ permease
MDDTWGPYLGTVAAVVVGLALLLYGQVAHGLDFLTWIGGALSIAAVGVLTMFVHRS